MKRTVLAIALMLGAVCANAQETTSSGDLYQGLTRKIAFERMIPPHGLEITYDKTVHIIFPSAVRMSIWVRPISLRGRRTVRKTLSV